MKRAYSLLEIKSLDDDKRIITGIATTPEADLMEDEVVPNGVEFKLPIPFLWQHDTRQPIGHVTKAKITKNGIEVEVHIAQLDEPATLKNQLDECWAKIRAGLVRGLSIGFKELEAEPIKGSSGIRFLRWVWLELSAVTIAANQAALITTIKQIDTALLAATGLSQSDDDRPTPPGASGKKRNPVVKAQEAKTMPKKTIAEQISAFEATRQAKAARMSEIMEDAGDKGETLDAPQKEEYDTLDGEVKSVDEHLVRLRALEKQNVVAAKAIEKVTDVKTGSEARSGSDPIRVSVKSPDLPKGTAFVRYVGALAATRGNKADAIEFAKRWHNSTPEVEMILRAPVNPGTTTDATWAEPLAQYQVMASEFIEFLRPLTIIGRIPGFRNVPFLIKVPRQTAGAAVNWVGEAKVKPVSSLAFDSVSLAFYKIAGIIPLSEELVRFSSPAAEGLVRTDLAAAITQFMDREFVDPTKAEAVGVSPASVTYGVTPVTASGTTAAALRADIKTLFGNWIAANLSAAGGVWIMTESMALSISLMRTALDQPEFPGITLAGGTLLGLPVVVSENLPATGGSPADGSLIILAKASEIMLADDGQVSIDVSREASLQMESAPDSPATASTVTVSLWQHNLIAIKAERFINWKKRRAEAVQFIQNAKYAA